MVGAAIARKLKNTLGRDHFNLDLRNQIALNFVFQKERPDYVFLAAGKVGGIQANNTQRAEFIYDNIMIAANVIHAAYKNGVKKLLYLGSSCIYPKQAEQPIKEDQLLSGYLEPTNEPYAIAKIAGIKLCEAYRDQYGCNFISAMPTNLYGPGDKYNAENSHVIPAMILKFHEAKINNNFEVNIWGSGEPLREFMYVDDLAGACIFLMENYNEKEHINIGTGEEISIKDLAVMIKETVGYEGRINFDKTKPDGTKRKLIDSSKLNNLGWKHSVGLRDGLKKTYEEFTFCKG